MAKKEKSILTKMTDYPMMIKQIDHKKWKDFFVKEAKKLKMEIFK